MTTQDLYRARILDELETRGCSVSTRLQYASGLTTMARAIGEEPDSATLIRYVEALPLSSQPRVRAAWNALHPQRPFPLPSRSQELPPGAGSPAEPAPAPVPLPSGLSVPLQSAVWSFFERDPELPLPVLHALRWEHVRWQGGPHPWVAFSATWRHPVDVSREYRMGLPLYPFQRLWKAWTVRAGAGTSEVPGGPVLPPEVTLDELHRIVSRGKGQRLPLCVDDRVDGPLTEW